MLYEYAPSVRKMSVISAFFLNDCFLKYIQKSVFLFFIRFVKFENWVDKLNNSNPVCGKVCCTGQYKMTMQLSYITFWLSLDVSLFLIGIAENIYWHRRAVLLVAYNT